MKIATAGSAIRLGVLVVVVLALAGWAWWTMIRMPGESHHGALPAPSAEQTRLAATLAADVGRLTGFGHRHVVDYPNLARAADWIESSFAAAGYRVEREGYELHGQRYENVVAERTGAVRPDEIVVVGAHYDTAEDRDLRGTVGANDNASGVAAVLALARALAAESPARSVRFVAFVNEEPPSFQREAMGSLVYAKRLRERGDDVRAMLSVETIGYYDDTPGSQKYPPPLGWFYPTIGNFIAFVGDVGSADLVRAAIASFRRDARFPSEGAALPAFLPGVGWSDHWAFWQAGYRAVMITDTAPFRYPFYHTPEDTPDKLDFDRMARVVAGLRAVVLDLASSEIDTDR